MGPKGQRLWPALVACVPNWSSQMNFVCVCWGGDVTPPSPSWEQFSTAVRVEPLVIVEPKAGGRRSGGFRGTKARSVHPANERAAEGGPEPSRSRAGARGDRRAAEGREQRRLGGLRRGHLLPPGQIKEAWRGHWEEMVPCFFGKSIRPTLNGAFCSPSSGVTGQVCFQVWGWGSDGGGAALSCLRTLRTSFCSLYSPSCLFSLLPALLPLSAQASS